MLEKGIADCRGIHTRHAPNASQNMARVNMARFTQHFDRGFDISFSQDYFSAFPSTPFADEASAYSAFVGNEGNVPSYLVGYPGSAGYFMGERGALRKK